MLDDKLNKARPLLSLTNLNKRIYYNNDWIQVY